MNVILLFGGMSEEYEISLRSAAALLPAFSPRHTVCPIGITRNGHWYATSATPAAIAADRWREWARPILLDPVRGALLDDGEPIACDVVFPLLHGGLGEGGGVAALLSLLRLPYVGCTPTAGALCMDKILTKRLAASVGIPVASFVEVGVAEPIDEPLVERLGKTLGYPMFVKPASSGSSVGAHRVECRGELLAALSDALAYGGRALCEEYIEGAEVEFALLADGDSLFGSVVGEIESGSLFYDYNAKYRDKTSRIFIPARIGRASADAVREYGRRLFRLLGCCGLSRIDFFVRRDGSVVFNEINTMPGFTDISMFPRLLRIEGLSLPDIVNILLENANR